MQYKSVPATLLMVATLSSASNFLSINNPVVSLFLGPNLPDIAYYGSILSSLPSLTAYQVQCSPRNTITLTNTSTPTVLQTITSTSTFTPGSTKTITSTRSPGITITITSTRSPGSTQTVTSSLILETLTTLIPEVLTSMVPEVATSLVPNVVSNAGGVLTSVVPNVITELIPEMVTSLVPQVITSLVPAGVGGILGGLVRRNAQIPGITVSIPEVISAGVGSSEVGVCLLGACENSTPVNLTPAQTPIPTTTIASCPFTGAPPQITQSNSNTFIGTFPSRTFTCTITSLTLGASCFETVTFPCGCVYTSTFTLPAAVDLLKPVTITAGFSTTSMYVSGPPVYGGMTLPPVSSSFLSVPTAVPPAAASTSICATSTQAFLPVPPSTVTSTLCVFTTPSSILTLCAISTLQTMVSAPTITSTSTITKPSTSTSTGVTTTVVGPQVTLGGGGTPFSEATKNKTSRLILGWVVAVFFGLAVLLL